MLRIGSQARRTASEAFICASCRRNQNLGPLTPRPRPFAFAPPKAKVCTTHPYSTNTAPAAEPTPDNAQAHSAQLDTSTSPLLRRAKRKHGRPRPQSPIRGPFPTRGLASQTTKLLEEMMTAVRQLEIALPAAPSQAQETAALPKAAEHGQSKEEESTETMASTAKPQKRKKLASRLKSARRPRLAAAKERRKIEASIPRRRRGPIPLGFVAPDRMLTFNPDELQSVPIHGEDGDIEVPTLKHGLGRALFNPGVYHFQDPNSKVYNFDPYLAKIMPAEEFDFDALRDYITSSKDTALLDLAAKEGKKYTGSTSSMTATLSHFHYLLSGFRPLNLGMMSHEFMQTHNVSYNFTQISMSPVATFLHWKDGAYAIDADKQFDTETVLSQLGKSMEKLLTLEKHEYEKYRLSNSTEELRNAARSEREAYHYTAMGDFLMRSQLDAHDKRLPGTGMFDLKTRAAVSIRMDIQNYENGQGYEIRKRLGAWESFEREYYDMIRAAFMKYSLQVRMGRMNGIFVAFHNTKHIFGFQYIPLSEMDKAIHSTEDTSFGDREYKASVHLLNAVLNRLTWRFPQKTLRLFFEARPGDPPFMYIFAKPVTPEEVAEVQGEAQEALENIERKIVEGSKEEAEEAPEKIERNAEGSKEEAEEAPEKNECIIVEGNEADNEHYRAGYTKHDVWKVMDKGRQDLWAKLEKAKADEDDDTWANVLGQVKDDICRSFLARDIFFLDQKRVTESVNRLIFTLVEGVRKPKSTQSETSLLPEYATAALERHSGVAPSQSLESLSLADLLVELFLLIRNEPPGHGDVPPGLNARSARALEKLETEMKERLIFNPANVKLVEDQPQVDVEKPTQDPSTERDSTRETAASDSDTSPVENTSEDQPDEELVGLVLAVQHKVNGKYVKRPSDLKPSDKWEIEYSITDLTNPKRTRERFQELQTRRGGFFKATRTKDKYFQQFRDTLSHFSKKGAEYREQMNEESMQGPVHVVGAVNGPFDPKSVFTPATPGGKYEPWEEPRSSS